MKTYEPLTPPEYRRNERGQFDRPGKTLSKTAKKTGLVKKTAGNEKAIGSGLPGPGRPKGSKNRTTIQLREAILNALDRVGGDKYLARLAVENSSAFASLLGKVLPTTLAASDSDGGASTQITFTRVIVHPGGHREIEGVSPKALPAPNAPTDPTLVTGGDRGRDGGGI